MAYPCIRELTRYDAEGAFGGGSQLELDTVRAQFFAAPRPFIFAPQP